MLRKLVTCPNTANAPTTQTLTSPPGRKQKSDKPMLLKDYTYKQVLVKPELGDACPPVEQSSGMQDCPVSHAEARPHPSPLQAMEGVPEQDSTDEEAPHTYKDEQHDAKSAFLQVGAGHGSAWRSVFDPCLPIAPSHGIPTRFAMHAHPGLPCQSSLTRCTCSSTPQAVAEVDGDEELDFAARKPVARPEAGGDAGGQAEAGEDRIKGLLDGYFGADETLEDEGDRFLKRYILSKGWVDREGGEASSSGDEAGTGPDYEEEEEYLQQAERYEHKYNFRFEYPGSETLVTHPRQVRGEGRGDGGRAAGTPWFMAWHLHECACVYQPCPLAGDALCAAFPSALIPHRLPTPHRSRAL